MAPGSVPPADTPADPPADPRADPSVPEAPPGALVEILGRIDHVGIAVRDLETALAFHVGVLGWVVDHREENQAQGVAEVMLRSPGAPDDASRVQLLAPLTADSPIGRFLERSGPGIQQLAYRVDDVVRVAGLLRDRGLRLLYDRPQPGTAGSLVNFVHPRDTGGVLIELVQAARDDEGDGSG